MTSRYREELKSWSKNDLVREVERLRAITREHADRPGEDTADLQGAIVDAAGDPFARSGAVIDLRNAILMDSIDVCMVDEDPAHPVADPAQTRWALAVSGRVNMRVERSTVLLMFPLDGAAALASELLGVAERAGAAHAEHLVALIAERMGRMPHA